MDQDKKMGASGKEKKPTGGMQQRNISISEKTVAYNSGGRLSTEK